jgi:carbon monoxide dehydrogenase subunit G
MHGRKEAVMLHFEGDRDFSLSPDELWSKLADIHFLAGCVPDAESVSFPDAETAQVVLRPGLSFVRGTLDLTMKFTEQIETSSARLLLSTKGIGTTSTVEAAFALSASDAGTRLHWSADVTQLGGLLKAVPQGLLKAAAQKVILDAWSALEARLAKG